MAEIIWTEPALDDLDAISDYITLDKPGAVKRVDLDWNHSVLDQW